MEWLRSCYRSSWRLFRGSQQQTRGFYYFCDPGTPHYPGLHNVWSFNWCNDDLQGQQATLGEVTPATRFDRPYFKGHFPVDPPPALLLGAGDCVEHGEGTPPPLSERPLIFGVDARCWRGNPPLAPPGFPWSWLRPEALEGHMDGDRVGRWKDSSLYSRDAFLTVPANFPTYVSSFALPSLRFDNAQALQWHPNDDVFRTYNLGTVVSVYMKGHTSSTVGSPYFGPVLFGVGIVQSGMPQYSNAKLQWSDNLDHVSVNTDLLLDVPITLWARRDGPFLNLGIVGHSDTVQLVNALGIVQPIGIAAGQVQSVPSSRRRTYIQEVVVYDRLLSDTEHAACLSYLAKKYP